MSLDAPDRSPVDAPLAGVRVIDLADPLSAFAGKVLADLGADVLLIEPPEGAPLRRSGPFLADRPGPDRGLPFWYYRGGVRNRVLDPTRPADRAELSALVAGADVLLEALGPDRLATIGVDLETIRQTRPDLIVVSLSPFGSAGPRAGWRGGDYLAWAAGGPMSLIGSADREPLDAPWQATHFAGLWTVIGSLAALLVRRRGGSGQDLEIALQEVVAAHASGATIFASSQDQRFIRRGGESGLVCPSVVAPCRDGHIQVVTVVRRQWQTLVRWLAEDGAADDFDDPSYVDVVRRTQERDRLHAAICRWTAGFDKHDLFRRAQAKGLAFGVVQTMADLAADPQLAARGFFRSLHHPLLAEPAPVAGPPHRLTGDRGSYAPPRLDAGRGTGDEGPSGSNRDVPLQASAAATAGITPSPPPSPSGERADLTHRVAAADDLDGDTPVPALGNPPAPSTGDPFSSVQRPAFDPDGVRATIDAPRSDQPSDQLAGALPGPLHGLRVLDFTWVWAGPFGTRILADLGADVIKVEQRGAGDGARWNPPFKDGQRGIDRSGLFNELNHNKRGLTVDLKHPDGHALIERLAVEWADVIVENFGAGTLERLGLAPADLHRKQPRLIVVRLAGFGQTGPYRDYLGYAPAIHALAGLTSSIHYPDRPPIGVAIPLGDYAGGLYGVVTTVAAAIDRERTGRGRVIDLSQFEAAVGMVGPGLLEALVNSREPEPRPNTFDPASGTARWIVRCRPGVWHPAGRPEAVEPIDRWLAVAPEAPGEWAALAEVVGVGEWPGRDATESTPVAEALKQALARWAADREVGEAAADLQGRGIPAAPVQEAWELVRTDPQLAARGFYRRVDHPTCGEVVTSRLPVTFSATAPSLRRAAPLLGEHNAEILGHVLGLTDAEIGDLVLREVV